MEERHRTQMWGVGGGGGIRVGLGICRSNRDDRGKEVQGRETGMG